MCIVAQVGHDAEFDLRIVRREEYTVVILGCKGFADLASQFVTHRNVLQVRIGGAEASGRGDGLVIGSVYLAGLRVDQFGQGIYISAE